MSFSSISQFALLIVGIAIIFTYIQPTFGEIKSLQDEVFIYADARDKATELNQKLAELTSQVSQFRDKDIDALEVYLPEEIDAIQVMADIEAIVRQHGMEVATLATGETTEGDTGVVLEATGEVFSSYVKHQDFEVGVTGSYEDLKRMLDALQRNKYPLEVVSFTVGAVSETSGATAASTEAGTYDLTLRVYAFNYAAYTAAAAAAEPELEEPITSE